MKKMSVLIVTADKDYCNNVIRYFRLHYSDSVLVSACPVLENVPEYVRNNSVSIIICDDEYKNELSDLVKSRCFIYGLTEYAASDENKTIAKYTSAPMLYNTLLFIYSRYVGAESVEAVSGAGNIYTFISANGCGATTLAMSFAENMSNRGKNVLFLGLDGFSDYSSMLSINSERGLSDIIMSLKSKNVNISLTAKSVTYSGKFKFIDKCRCSDDIYELDKTELRFMLDKIVNSDKYDAVIIDTTFFYTDLWEYLSENSRVIFAVTTNNNSSVAKTNNLIDTIKIRDFRTGTNALEKLDVIVNKCSSGKLPAKIDCDRISFLSKYPADNYASMLKKIASDDIWSQYAF